MSDKTLVGLIIFGLFLATAVSAAGPAPVNLGTAGSFAILSKSGISTTGTTSIVGDIGVSPIDSTAITGFGLIMHSSNEYATSSLLTGKAYAADYTAPTPAKMTAAISDMETAYTDAAGRSNPTATELGAGNIDGMTIGPGLYKWGTGVMIPTGVTLSGGPDDVWIFQIAQNLDVGNGAIVTLAGGAQAKNVFWQLFGQATLGTTADMKGTILSQTSIAINTGAKLNGRALAQTAVTLDANAVTLSSGSGGSATPMPTANASANATPTPTANPSRNADPTTPAPLPSASATATPTSKPALTPSPTFGPSATPTDTLKVRPTVGGIGATPKATVKAESNKTAGTSGIGQTTEERPTLRTLLEPTANLVYALIALGIIAAVGGYGYFVVLKK
ncbi:DUF3494 domain-containing protein [Candidatus Micrarchaeota archaeon]|nr:DUF3494 domain-containing protein [Candidatus Micrarchaeota archaeon]